MIELRTIKEIVNKNKEHSFKRYIVPKVWAKCYLVGIENIYFGFFDKNGILKDIKKY